MIRSTEISVTLGARYDSWPLRCSTDASNAAGFQPERFQQQQWKPDRQARFQHKPW
jgi:hypothetical protein